MRPSHISVFSVLDCALCNSKYNKICFFKTMNVRMLLQKMQDISGSED